MIFLMLLLLFFNSLVFFAAPPRLKTPFWLPRVLCALYSCLQHKQTTPNLMASNQSPVSHLDLQEPHADPNGVPIMISESPTLHRRGVSGINLSG